VTFKDEISEREHAACEGFTGVGARRGISALSLHPFGA
jgi:hypothetical protein